MRMKKIFSLVALSLCVSLGLRAESGTCGAYLNWEYADSTLTITGSGPMTNFADYYAMPWVSVRGSIARVVLPEGLTRIGNGAFWGCSQLRTVTSPSKVTHIGSNAFRE